MRNLARDSTYTYSEAPHQEHQDIGNTKLTDGKYADLKAFWDPAWVATRKIGCMTVYYIWDLRPMTINVILGVLLY